MSTNGESPWGCRSAGAPPNPKEFLKWYHQIINLYMVVHYTSSILGFENAHIFLPIKSGVPYISGALWISNGSMFALYIYIYMCMYIYIIRSSPFNVIPQNMLITWRRYRRLITVHNIVYKICLSDVAFFRKRREVLSTKILCFSIKHMWVCKLMSVFQLKSDSQKGNKTSKLPVPQATWHQQLSSAGVTCFVGSILTSS